jgi:phospholipase/carboxylesterase
MSASDNPVVVNTGADPRWAVLWLHGLGADGHDFEPIVPELITRSWPAIRFVFPHAPVQRVTINGGAAMRAWYDIKSLDREGLQDDAGIRKSVASISAMLDAFSKTGFASERIFLAGFSQGGAVALAAGLRFPHRLAGILALSSYLPLSAQTATEAAAENRKTPIFIAHGSMDPVVAPAFGEASAKALSAMDYPVQFKRYPMAHSVCAEELTDIRAFMEKRWEKA